jgi:alpha-galactosidase
VFGLFVATGDQHAGEYVAHAHQHVGVSGYDFAKAERERAQMWADIGGVVSGELDPGRFLALDTGERAVPIICGILENTNQYELSVDVPNRGHVSNLPDGLIVEVPALVSGRGVEGLAVGPLPDGIAVMCRRQMEIASLAVDAAVSGDRALALEALILDPLVPSPRVARAILSELLEAEAAYLPQFR